MRMRKLPIYLIAMMMFPAIAQAQPVLNAVSVSYDQGTHLFSGVVKNNGPVPTHTGVNIAVAYLVDGIKKSYGVVTGPIASGATQTFGNTGTVYTIPAGSHTISMQNNVNDQLVDSITSNITVAGVPVNTALPVITGPAQVGMIETTTTGSWTNSPTSFAIVWDRDGTPISGATATTYTPVTADLTHTLATSIIATNSTGSSGPAISAATAAVTNPTQTLPDLIATSITYDPVTHLFSSTAKNVGNAATPNGVRIGVAYNVDGVKQSWGNNNAGLAVGASEVIGNSGPPPYTIPAGTHTISVLVDDGNLITESNENNNTLSASITIGGASVPVNSAVPVISGTPQVGQVLTSDHGVWTNTPTSYADQWNKTGTAIAGATAQTYTPVAGDAGATLTDTVVASNPAGNSLPATSAATAPIQPVGSAMPDLIVTAVGYDPVTHLFSSTIKNQGNGSTPTPAVTIGVQYLVDGVAQSWGWEIPDPATLTPGASATVGNQGPTYTIPTGVHTITAFVDDVNRIVESDETNNKLSASITIGTVGTCFGTPDGTIPAGVFDPNYPPKLNYSLIFDSEFNDFADFDTSCEANAPSDSSCNNQNGKNWYPTTWTFPGNSMVASTFGITGGVLSIKQPNHTGNWALSTLAKHGGGSGPVVGISFKGGWYAEARMASEYRDGGNNVVPAPGANPGHSSFWAYVHPDDQNANGNRFIENDMFDGVQDTHLYQTNLIDWMGGAGINAVGTGMNQFDQVELRSFGFPGDSFVDRTSMHVIGQLWVPAAGGNQGYLQNYFDGKPTSKFSWTPGACDPMHPGPGTGCGSIMDSDRVGIIIGADPPAPGDPTDTMYVDWVHVWQTPAATTASGNSVITPQTNFKGGNNSCP